MALVVADTDVLIDFLRGRPSDRLQAELALGTLATTAITVFELLSGARGAVVEAVEILLAAVTVFDLNEAAARRAGQIRTELEALGSPIGTADYLIAGVCISRGAELLTRNTRHFERVPGLELVE